MNRTKTNSIDVALLILRIGLGVIFMAHGAQKLFGAFGGSGLAATVEHMGSLGYLVSVGEFFGGLGILLGFLSRFSGASLVVIMIGAIVQVHGANGFFGSSKGYEYNLALMAMAATILIAGPGRLAMAKLFPAKALPYLE